MSMETQDNKTLLFSKLEVNICASF